MKVLLTGVVIFFWAALSFAQQPQWKHFQAPVLASLRGLSPISDQICWASGSGGTWLRTEDGGVSWHTGTVAGLDTVDFRSIQAFDSQTAVVASAGQPAVIYRTEDGGNSWQKVHQEGLEAFFDAIQFVDNQQGYVLGDPIGGKWMVVETLDGGNSWQSLSSLPEALDGEAAFAASSSSLVVDGEGLVFATGGSSSRLHRYSFRSQRWSVRELPEIIQGAASQGVFALSFITKTGSLVLVGGDYLEPDVREGNSLITFKDESKIPSSGPFGYRSGVAYLEEPGWLIAVGPDGSDYTKDGGNHWILFSSVGFHAVKAAVSGNVLWASGSKGRLAKLVY
uniref:WD40/YVTN/BNR-like repeat-containing protein n=1 Tax=Algoriphagus sp. TaxID=1872435 RepID=UPI00404812ED